MLLKELYYFDGVENMVGKGKKCCINNILNDLVDLSFGRVQRFPEKVPVLQDKCLLKSTRSTLISTLPPFSKFKLKVTQVSKQKFFSTVSVKY